jgi:type IV secretion system protein VirB8
MRKKESPQIDKALGASVNYEVSLADVVRRSERRAWFVAFAAILMALILACGYFLVLPLKERIPFLVMADAYTGQATVARLRGDFGQNSITANEALNKSNIAHYIIARESYDVTQRNIRDWNTIYTMSTKELAAAYTLATYDQRNPSSLVNVYGTGKAIRVEIISITLLDSSRSTTGPGTGGGDATVRFQRLLVDKGTGASQILDTRVANLRYNYNKALALDEKQRFDNPLGFQVISYRVDTELVSIPVQPPNSASPAGQAPTLSQQQVPALPTGGTAPAASTAPPQGGATVPAQSPQAVAPAPANPNGVNTQ